MSERLRESEQPVTEEAGPEPAWLRVSEAAERVGFSAASLRKWSDEGLVETYRTPGGQRRYREEDLARFLDGLRESSDGSKMRVDNSA